jgi:hypothetical protein
MALARLSMDAAKWSESLDVMALESGCFNKITQAADLHEFDQLRATPGEN